MMSSDAPGMTSWHCARFVELGSTTLYDLLRLRGDVFVVEQACVYPDLDGRDREEGTEHLWAQRAGEVVAYLRVLVEAGALRRVGRLAVAPRARGDGLARELMQRALERCPGSVVLDAQSRLVPWYRSLGFVPAGDEYTEAGIAHVPMRLER
ncbi:MAG: GNAT family N-acetyltransferase [Candidatus Dormibacteria bacterium]